MCLRWRIYCVRAFALYAQLIAATETRERVVRIQVYRRCDTGLSWSAWVCCRCSDSFSQSAARPPVLLTTHQLLYTVFYPVLHNIVHIYNGKNCDYGYFIAKLQWKFSTVYATYLNATTAKMLSDQMTQPIASKHWRKPVGHWDKLKSHQNHSIVLQYEL